MKISKELKAGAIAILAIISFVVMFQFMNGKNVFTRDNVFYVKYDNVEGLKRSSEVYISGLKVGQVDEIIHKTAPNGKIYFLVKMLVNPDFSFSKNSTVEISEPGLMSSKILNINMVHGEPLAKSGDTLKSSIKLSMFEGLAGEVGPISDQLKKVLKTVDSLGNNANKVFNEQNRRELAALILNLNRTVQALEGTAGYANQLISSNDPRIQKMLDNADRAVVTANSAIGKYGNLAESIDTQKLNGTLANLDVTVGRLNAVISNIERGEGTLGKVVKDEQLYKNLQEVTENLNHLLIDVKENPKKYVNFSVFGKNAK